MWLTSNLPPVQKSEYLQLWEDGDEKVLVSTFTDGIDNTATEDIIIVGGGGAGLRAAIAAAEAAPPVKKPRKPRAKKPAATGEAA